MQDATLSGKSNVVPAATNSRTVRVAPGTNFSGLNARHFSSNAENPVAGVKSKASDKEVKETSMIANGL